MNIIDIRYTLNIKTNNYNIMSCGIYYHCIKLFLSKNNLNNPHEIVNEFLKYLDITPTVYVGVINNKEVDIYSTRCHINELSRKIDSKFKKSYYVDDVKLESLYSITNSYDLYCIKNSSEYIEAYFINDCLQSKPDF